jgi:hypothetical protein
VDPWPTSSAARSGAHAWFNAISGNSTVAVGHIGKICDVKTCDVKTCDAEIGMVPTLGLKFRSRRTSTILDSGCPASTQRWWSVTDRSLQYRSVQ